MSDHYINPNPTAAEGEAALASKRELTRKVPEDWLPCSEPCVCPECALVRGRPVGVRWVKPEPDTVYPDPRSLSYLEHELRYGEHQNLSAASVVAAYRALFDPAFGAERHAALLALVVDADPDPFLAAGDSAE